MSEEGFKPEAEGYREELAHKLRDIRNSDSENPQKAHAKAEGYLDAKKESGEYLEAEEKTRHTHKEKVEREKEPEYPKVEAGGRIIEYTELENEITGTGEAYRFVDRLNKETDENFSHISGRGKWRLPSVEEIREVLYKGPKRRNMSHDRYFCLNEDENYRGHGAYSVKEVWPSTGGFIVRVLGEFDMYPGTYGVVAVRDNVELSDKL